MAAEKRTRPVEGLYLGIESRIRLKAEKIRPKKPEKVDQEKMYPIEAQCHHHVHILQKACQGDWYACLTHAA